MTSPPSADGTSPKRGGKGGRCGDGLLASRKGTSPKPPLSGEVAPSGAGEVRLPQKTLAQFYKTMYNRSQK